MISSLVFDPMFALTVFPSFHNFYQQNYIEEPNSLNIIIVGDFQLIAF